MSDTDVVVKALSDAAAIVSGYLEPGPRDAEATIQRLIEVLDNQKLAAAIERLGKLG